MNACPDRNMYGDSAAQRCSDKYVVATRTFSCGIGATTCEGGSAEVVGKSGTTTNGRVNTAYTAYMPVRQAVVAIVMSRRLNMPVSETHLKLPCRWTARLS